MTSADFLQLAITLGVMGAVAWVAYRAGQYAARKEAQNTITQLRNHLRRCRQLSERTSYELSSLRDALRTSKLTGLVEPPSWMEGQDG